MIALSVMYVPNCMIFYFCITWLPTYLLERHGFNISGMALFAGLPLLVSIPGRSARRLVDRPPVAAATASGSAAAGWAAAAYIVVGFSPDRGRDCRRRRCSPPLLIAAGTGVTMFTLGAAWGTAIEIGGNHVGVVGGTMNSIGNLIAMLNPLIVAYSVQWFGSWDVPLYVMGGLFLVGAGCWALIDPTAAGLRRQADRYSRCNS